MSSTIVWGFFFFLLGIGLGTGTVLKVSIWHRIVKEPNNTQPDISTTQHVAHGSKQPWSQ